MQCAALMVQCPGAFKHHARPMAPWARLSVQQALSIPASVRCMTSSASLHARREPPPRYTVVLPASPQRLSKRTAAHALAAAAPAATATVAATSQGAAAQVLAILLGYACMIGSCFRSVPQLVKIFRAGGSTEGLSLISNITELLCFTVMVAYNMSHHYAFNTYGEIFACWLQDIIIVALICRHSKYPPQYTLPAALAFLGLCAWLFQPGACPPDLLAALQLSTVFVMALGSRVPQIMLNIQRGNSGVMSMTTCVLNVLGNAARIFTTLVLTQDMLLLSGGLIQGVLNSILLYQAWDTKRQHKAAVPPGPEPGLAPIMA